MKHMNNKLFWLSITALFIASCGKKNQPTPTATHTTQTLTVTTLAGGGTGLATNGIGTAASFNYPTGLALDSAGNVYVADFDNGMVRKITPEGVVTTVFTGGEPAGVAVDAGQNIYVADYAENLIFGTTGGGFTVIAGGGDGTATNGLGTAASFSNPYGIAVSTTGENLYVADLSNNLIRKTTNAFSAPVTVSTLAGIGAPGAVNGAGTVASFNAPSGICIDIAGNIYVADANNNLIRKITPTGSVSTLAGGGSGIATNGTGTGASFNQPTGVAVDDGGNVYVADTGNHIIRKITPVGVVSTLAGNGISGAFNGIASNAEFASPDGIAVDAKGQNVYVCDRQNNLVRKISIVTTKL